MNPGEGVARFYDHFNVVLYEARTVRCEDNPGQPENVIDQIRNLSRIMQSVCTFVVYQWI